MTRPSWKTLLVLLLVPALVAGGVLWGTWRSDDRLRQVQAAVVNLDEMVEVNGQMMPLGRQLAAELVDSDRDQNVTWVLADAENGAEGLRSGRYAAVVTIPAAFSASATSFAKPADEAVQATITVETSPVVGISETAVGQAIAHAAVQALNGLLTREYLKNIYVGFTEMSTSMLELVDGTRLLADGAAELADGADRSAAGAHDLAGGLRLASDGGVQLADGARQSADGADQLAGGAGAIAEGTRAWASGAARYAAGVDTYAGGAERYADGMGTFAAGLATYADGVDQYAGGINGVLAPVRDGISLLPEWGGWLAAVDAWVADAPEHAADASAELTPLLAQVRAYVEQVDGVAGHADGVSDAVADARAGVAALASGSVPCPDAWAATPGACEAFAAGAAAAAQRVDGPLADAAADATRLTDAVGATGPARERVLAALDRLDAAVAGLDGWAAWLQQSYGELMAALPPGTPLTRADTLALLDQLEDAGRQLTAGGRELATGADGLAVGAAQLAGGADALAGGAHELAGGAGQLADGMGSLADGADALAGGLAQLSDGVDAYTGGIAQAADGSTLLAGGLDQLADGAWQLADGTDELAAGVAEGQGAIPTYTDAEADRLATVVAAPVDADGLAGLVRPGLAWASLLLVLALWAGALATFAALAPVAPNALTSRAGDVRLLAGTLMPGLGIVAAQALLLTAVGALVLSLPAASVAALAGVMLVAGLGFALVNHALAALAGNAGRLAALAMALVTAVVAATSAAPGALQAVGVLSPLTPALEAVRAVGVGAAPTVPALTLVGWGLVALVGSLAAVNRARTVRVEDLAIA